MFGVEPLITQYYKDKGKAVRKQTITTYVSRLSAIFKLVNIRGTDDFIKLLDVENVIEILEAQYKSTSSLTTSISAILILIQALTMEDKPDDPALLKYRKYLLETQARKNEEKKTSLNTSTELKLNKQIITKLGKEYKKKMYKNSVESVEGIIQAQKHMIFGIYTLLPPIRNDLPNMKKVETYSASLSSDFNYLIVDNFHAKMAFVFKNYKTVGLYGENTVFIPPKLRKMFMQYIDVIGDDEYMFVNPRSKKPYTKSQMSLLVVKTFEGAGITELRKYYLSVEFQDIFKLEKKFEKVAKSMMNSKARIINSYVQLLNEIKD